MLAENLIPTADPLVMHGRARNPYTKRICAYKPCSKKAWIQTRGRFCSRSCARLARTPRGENHPQWTGDDATYWARHQRVYQIRGRADHCSLRPGLSDCISEDYEWAQIHGTGGLDVREYVALCVPCHRAYDVAGSRNPVAVLTEEIVAECRCRNAAGESQSALAREFGVSQPTMRDAIIGKTWRHVPMPWRPFRCLT